MASPFLPPGFVYPAVPTSGMCSHLWLAPGEWVAELLYLLLQGHHCGQGFLVGFPNISQTYFYQRFPPLPFGGLVPGGSDIHQPGTCCCLWCIPLFLPLAVIEGRHHLLHQFWFSGGDPGSLRCLYTLRYKECNSSWLV